MIYNLRKDEEINEIILAALLCDDSLALTACRNRFVFNLSRQILRLQHSQQLFY